MCCRNYQINFFSEWGKFMRKWKNKNLESGEIFATRVAKLTSYDTETWSLYQFLSSCHATTENCDKLLRPKLNASHLRAAANMFQLRNKMQQLLLASKLVPSSYIKNLITPKLERLPNSWNRTIRGAHECLRSVSHASLRSISLASVSTRTESREEHQARLCPTVKKSTTTSKAH